MRLFASLFLLGMIACRTSPETVSPTVRGQNLLLVTVDTLRADRLGAYGYAPARTPNLDALARSGVVFEQAVAPVPVTLPSHASLLTGLFPPSHGVRDNTYFRLDDEATTLAEVLKNEGYHTSAFVGAFVLDEEFGLAQGFDVYDDLGNERGGDTAGTIAERKGAEVADAFLEWVRRPRGEEPFFAWLHLFDPHLPYAPPAPFSRDYDGEIAYVDEQIGRLTAALDELELRDETLVVVTSDHGESLGEHGEKSHGFFVYDATVRVPWILASPGVVPPGERIARQVSTVDLLPTVLALLNIESPPAIHGQDVLAPDAESRPAYAECYASLFNFHWAPLVSMREDGFKYIDAPKPELYDLDRDPGETENLLETLPERARDMKARLAELVSDLPPSFASRSRRQPDPDTVARLRALGYAASAPSTRESEPGLADPKDRLHLWRKIEEVILDKSRGELGRAGTGAEEVLKEDPTNLLALELLADVRSREGELAEATVLYGRMLAIDDSRPLTHLAHGDLLWRTGNPEGAESSFRRATELDPDFARAHLRLGELLLATDRASAARDSFAKARVLRTDTIEARLGTARALQALGDARGALSSLEALSDEHPRDPRVLAEYAGTLARGGREADAVALLEKGPDHHDVHYTLSVLYRSMGRMDEALAQIDEALALAPDSAVARHDRGVLLSRLGRLDDAVSALEHALVLRDVPATRNALGTALCRMERCADGIVHFERAVEQAPSFRDALENLAMAYRVLGRPNDAERVEARLASLVPR